MSPERKKDIIKSLDDGTFSSAAEINADLGEIEFKDTPNRRIKLKNTTPLVYAVHAKINNKEATIKWLLNKDAKLFEKYFISNSSHVNQSFKEELPINTLIYSLENYHSEIVDWFIRNKKPISEYRDKDGNTLLHLLASDNYYLESFKKLYKSNSNLSNLEATNNNGQTPLHIAITLMSSTEMPGNQIAQYIINESNVDLTKQYKTQEKTGEIEDILFNRVWINSYNLAELRLSACKNIMQLKKIDEPLNNNGDRLIHFFAEDDQWLQGMNLLLNKADLSVIKRTNKNGKTALHAALDNNKKGKINENIIKNLITSNKFDLTQVYEIQETFSSKDKKIYGSILHLP